MKTVYVNVALKVFSFFKLCEFFFFFIYIYKVPPSLGGVFFPKLVQFNYVFLEMVQIFLKFQRRVSRAKMVRFQYEEVVSK